MIRIAAVSGSLRKGSFNTALIDVSKKVAPENMSIEKVDISQLPVYNMDLEADLPSSVREFHGAIKKADGVLFLCPEHNFSFSGVLKNAIDWGSRPPGHSVWDGLPVIIQSAAAGWAGGLRAQYHLHQVVLYFDMKLLRYPEVCIGSAHKKFDGDLNLTDEMALENIEKQLRGFAELIEANKR